MTPEDEKRIQETVALLEAKVYQLQERISYLMQYTSAAIGKTETTFAELEKSYNDCVQGTQGPKAGWFRGKFYTKALPHGDPVYRQVPEVPGTEEWWREWHQRNAQAWAEAEQKAGQTTACSSQGAGVTGILGVGESVSKWCETCSRASDRCVCRKGESSFDFVEKKVKVICPRCGDRPWPTAKPFDETDLNCPACGSRELERIG